MSSSLLFDASELTTKTKAINIIHITTKFFIVISSKKNINKMTYMLSLYIHMYTAALLVAFALQIDTVSIENC
jgi:hypothetical protein